MNIVGIHQPNFFPWLGYFNKISKSTTFVFLDQVKYTKGSYCNRVKIKNNQGEGVWLTMPITNHKDGQLFDEVTIDRSSRIKMINMLKASYINTPFYKTLFDFFVELLNKDIHILSEFNIEGIVAVSSLLGLDTKFVKMSQLNQQFGAKNDLNFGICQHVQADAYLSGDGAGKDYNNEKLYSDNHIQLKYTNFKHPEYTQVNGPFLSHMSIMDVLLNCGVDQTKQLLL